MMISGGFILYGRSKELNLHIANEISIRLLGEKNRRYVLSDSHPDFLRIKKNDGESSISVDQTRLISEFLSITAEFRGYKVVIIESAEDMNINASNSILKILEEPIGSSVIILTTGKLFSLLATIRSRCKKIFVNTAQGKIYSNENEFFKQLWKCLESKSSNIQILPEQREMFFDIILNHTYGEVMTSLSYHNAEKYLELTELIENSKNTYLDHQSLVDACFSIVQLQG
jgi:DNA polymerase III delta prime subunit